MHAVHGGVMHPRHREAKCDRACDQSHAVLPRQERAQAAIGGDDRNQNRQQDHRGVVRNRKIAGEAVNADIVHAHDPRTEQHRRRDHAPLRRFANAQEEQGNADHQRADQERHHRGKHEIDSIGRDGRGQHADKMHGPDTDGEERGSAGEQRAAAHARRPADARREAETGVTTQDRDHHRERDEIGIVSFEHDRLGRPSPRAKPPPAAEFIGAALKMTIKLAGRGAYTIPAATWPRSRSRLSSVLAQASATSTPLVAKCLRKKSKCAAVSWNCCGVSTAENTGTSVRSCTSISALITVSAIYSSSTTSPAATIAVYRRVLASSCACSGISNEPGTSNRSICARAMPRASISPRNARRHSSTTWRCQEDCTKATRCGFANRGCAGTGGRSATSGERFTSEESF